MPNPELLDPLRTALEAQDLNAFTELLCPDVAWGPRVIRTLRPKQPPGRAVIPARS